MSFNPNATCTDKLGRLSAKLIILREVAYQRLAELLQETHKVLTVLKLFLLRQDVIPVLVSVRFGSSAPQQNSFTDVSGSSASTRSP